MPAVVLFIGRVLLVVALFIFLFCIMKTGVGLVKGQKSDAAVWSVDVVDAPPGIRGTHADIVLPGIYVSGKHARFSIQGPALVVEDLGSMNGTSVNNRPIAGTVVLHDGDMVQIGDVSMRVTRQ